MIWQNMFIFLFHLFLPFSYKEDNQKPFAEQYHLMQANSLTHTTPNNKPNVMS